MQKKFNQVEDELNPLKLALEKCKTAFKIVFVFAFVINLLMLVTPLYSLQVLDRVLGSRNLNTLLLLSLIIAFVYFVHMLTRTMHKNLILPIDLEMVYQF